MMSTLIFLIGFAIVVLGFAISVHFLDRKHSRQQKHYRLHQRRDELVFLAVENKISVNDQLFKDLFEFLESFEEVCNNLSLKHIIEGKRKNKTNPMNERRVKEFIESINNSSKEVQAVAVSSLRDTAIIVIANSITIKFLFYLLKIAVFTYLPAWFRTQIKRLFGQLWEAAKGVELIESNYGLQPAER